MRIASAALLTVLPLALCASGPDVCATQPPAYFEKNGYRVNEVRVTMPMLPQRLLLQVEAQASAELPVRGSAFSVGGYERGRAALRRAIRRLPPGFNSTVSLTVIAAGFGNCRHPPGAPQLDLVYVIGGTKLPSLFTNATTSFSVEVPDPLETNRLGARSRALSVTPILGYNAEESVFAGGRLTLLNPAGMLNRFSAEGRGSGEMSAVHVALGGGYDRGEDGGWLQRLDWAFEYSSSARPAGDVRLSGDELTLRAGGRTAPLNRGGLFFAFGGALSGGHHQSSSGAHDPGRRVVSNSALGSLRLYAGAQFTFARTLVNASYGIQASTLLADHGVDFVKHLAEIDTQSSFLLAGRWMDHRPFNLDLRFSSGLIAGGGPVPLTERFFGGNAELTFLPGADWSMRAAPFIRSLPAQSLSGGSGADAFAVLNLTLAAPLYRKALVPREVGASEDFRQQVNGQFDGFAKALATAYNRPDAAYGRLSFLSTHLETLLQALNAVGEMPEALEEPMQACREAASELRDTLEVIEREPIGFLVRADSDRSLSHLRVLCLESLNRPLKDPAIAAAYQPIVEDERFIAGQMKTGRSTAEKRGEADIAYARRIFWRVAREMNLFAVSPVLVFDMARLGFRSTANSSATRLGLGGGLRVTLANSFHVHAGYAVNPSRLLGEPAGALFFGLALRDPLR